MSQRLEISDKYSVYCFDIFDTIVSRKIQPEYVKKIWAKDIAEIYELKEGAEGLYKLRNQLEAQLCQENEKAGLDLEFLYKDLIDALFVGLGLDINSEEFYNVCFETELAIENRVQYLCEDTVETIKHLKGLGKKIYCVSDFYTPKEFLQGMFEYQGILELFDDIYVSSHVKLTKRSGRLYDYVIEQLKLDPADAMMVGDNKWSDEESAKNHGFNAYHIDRTQRHAGYESFAKEVASFDAKKSVMDIYRKCNRNEYEDLTFSLYYFTEKLYYDLLRRGVKNVFFLSREGEFLKKIFDKFQAKRVSDEDKQIRTHYLMVSRKATLMVSLKPLEEENFEMIFRQYINISLYDFLSSLGYAESEQEAIGKEIDFDIHEKVTDLPRSEVYAKLLANDTFKNLYEAKRMEQKNNFTAYLESFGVDFDKESMCLVDVGWKGTIQDNILVYFEGKQEIIGLYLGLVAPGKEDPKNIKRGLVFDLVNRGRSGYFDIYNENKSIFEVILGATHGSADRYVNENGKITVATAQRKEERDLFEQLISPIQTGIEKTFDAIDEALVNRAYTVSSLQRVWADIHAHLVFFPTKKQMDIFYKIYHFENFGVFEFTKFKTNDRISIKDRIKNFARMMKQKKAFFATSFWGVIALRDAGLSMFIKPYGYYMYNRFFKKIAD